MSFCFSTATKTKTKTNVFSLLLSDFFLFCSFILSHPLYFSYFIFFSPYLLKLFSFLSPLFITTSLLLLSLLTVSPQLVDNNPSSDSTEPKEGFFFTTYLAIIDSLRSKLGDEDSEFQLCMDLEAYNLVFETLTVKVGESSVEFLQLKYEGDYIQAYESPSLGGKEEKPIEVNQMKPGGDKQEGLLQGLGVSDDLARELLEKKEEMLGVDSRENGENQEEWLAGSEVKAMGVDKVGENQIKVTIDNSDGGYTPKVTENAEMKSPNLGNFGSMRREKEWKRTLACKLYEERQNVGEEEGMDMLWEAYEDSGKTKVKSKDMGAKKSEIEYHESEGEEEDMDGKLCCLQALRFSTGKMNFGMGRSNIVKFSKALKGIGWFHHVSRHGKKR